MIQVQITLISEGGYRPLSHLIECESWQDYQENKDKYRSNAILNICAKRHMTIADLRKYKYTQVKARVYDRERIAKENAERYERIKKKEVGHNDRNDIGLYSSHRIGKCARALGSVEQQTK